jgi:hypothetical protein
MITLAFGQMAYFTATSLAPYGGDDGLTVAARNTFAGFALIKNERAFYYVVFACLLGSYLFCRALVASRFGRVLRGDTLEMILSEGQATIRQFNKLEAITVRSRTFLMANGNNIQISGDMSRRGIKINILPRSASPESDVFPFTPEDYVTEHRDALLSDYYTIMRAYRLAGMPRSGLPAVGSFSEWERKVRDLIFWLTGHDLSGGFKKNKLDDPEQQEDAAVLSALRSRCRP